jgi:hypothetical protein
VQLSIEERRGEAPQDTHRPDPDDAEDGIGWFERMRAECNAKMAAVSRQPRHETIPSKGSLDVVLPILKSKPAMGVFSRPRFV